MAKHQEDSRWYLPTWHANANMCREYTCLRRTDSMFRRAYTTVLHSSERSSHGRHETASESESTDNAQPCNKVLPVSNASRPVLSRRALVERKCLKPGCWLAASWLIYRPGVKRPSTESRHQPQPKDWTCQVGLFFPALLHVCSVLLVNNPNRTRSD